MTASSFPRVVAGFGRSGTTWVQDVLAQSNRLRTVFEPLHPKHVPEMDPYAHTYLPPDADDPRLYELLHPFMCGRFQSLWADYRIAGFRVFPRLRDFQERGRLRSHVRYLFLNAQLYRRYRRQRGYPERIVKFVRGNMLLGWMQKAFDARIVFVIRHPAAVVLSQVTAAGAWRPTHRMERYRRDPRLANALDAPTKALLDRELDDVEACTLSWCIENGIALQQAADAGIHVVQYETLIRDGSSEWRKIVDSLQLQAVPDEKLIRQPSQQAWGRKAANAELVRKYDLWRDEIDAGMAARIQAILDQTGITMYSVDKAEPHHGGPGRS